MWPDGPAHAKADNQLVVFQGVIPPQETRSDKKGSPKISTFFLQTLQNLSHYKAWKGVGGGGRWRHVQGGNGNGNGWAVVGARITPLGGWGKEVGGRGGASVSDTEGLGRSENPPVAKGFKS